MYEVEATVQVGCVASLCCLLLCAVLWQPAWRPQLDGLSGVEAAFKACVLACGRCMFWLRMSPAAGTWEGCRSRFA